ncbi:hypothetical protein D3C87_143170 [compost metagenome]
MKKILLILSLFFSAVTLHSQVCKDFKEGIFQNDTEYRQFIMERKDNFQLEKSTEYGIIYLNKSNLLIGKWEGKWDDISVLLEFEAANKGSISYSNPLKKIAFVYKIQKDSVFLKYPKSIKSYKFSVKDDELFLNSKESDQESAEIIELITYVKKK